MKLRDLVEIQIGYQNRDRARPMSALIKGSHRIVQIKDLDLEGSFESTRLGREGMLPRIWTNNLFWVTPSSDVRRYQVDQGNVLFLYRGQRPLAITVSEHIPETIASYYFYILRLHLECVLPEYLAWFINQPSAQAYLESHQLGSHIKMIPKSAFENMEIVLPSLAIQRLIVDLEKLRQKEEYSMARLVKARKTLVNRLALQAALAGHEYVIQ